MSVELSVQELQKENAQLRQRVAKLERTVQFLLNNFNLTYVDNENSEPYADVAALMRQGNKIEAIKRYRQLTGASLAEAQSFVEKL